MSLILSIGIVFQLVWPSLAADGPSAQNWTFAPEIGLEGRASIGNQSAHYTEVECGNGGGPSIAFRSSKESMDVVVGTKKIFPIRLEIDGESFDQKFECHDMCGSFGFPSRALISAMKRGKQLRFYRNSSLLAEFTLKGSNETISRLAGCLGPDSGQPDY